MSLLEETKFLLRTYRIIPKKLLGQNFMVESSILRSMLNCAFLHNNDVVLDIGAGLGFLTRLLAANCKSVLAVESDARLVRIMREQLKNLPNVKIIEGNVLKVPIPQFNKIVSIPPYRISSRLLLWLFCRDFECAVLIFQKEFAKRLVASIRTEDYGWMTVLTYYNVEVELLEAVPKYMFYPQPEVDSIIIRLKRRKVPPFELKSEALFNQIVPSLFIQRNRKVRNAIMPFLKKALVFDEENASVLIESLPFLEKRVRELAPEDFGVLANALSE